MPASRRRPLSRTSASEAAHVDEVTGDRGCSSHRRTHQMRSAAGTLAAFEIAVRGGSAAFTRLQPIIVHREAHRAAGLAPLEAGAREELVQPLRFSLPFDRARA